MRHIFLLGAIAPGARRMLEATSMARLVALAGGALRAASTLLCASLGTVVEVSIRPDSRCRNCRVISDHLLVWWASLRNDFSRAIEVASMKVCMGVFPKQ